MTTINKVAKKLIYLSAIFFGIISIIIWYYSIVITVCLLSVTWGILFTYLIILLTQKEAK
jgi:hypothetical protein